LLQVFFPVTFLATQTTWAIGRIDVGTIAEQ